MNRSPERPLLSTVDQALTIAMVSDDFLPAGTGAGVHIQKVTRELVRLGHRVLVLTSRRPGQPATEVWNGVELHRFFSVPTYGMYQAIPSRSAIRQILIENRVDVIHYQYLSFMMLQAMSVAGPMWIRAVYTAHMTIDHITQPFFMKPFRNILTRLYIGLCEKFDDIVCVSAKQGRQMEQFNLTSRVHIITNPIDFKGDEAKPVERTARFVVLYAGRLSPEKNIGFLLRGFKILADSRPGVELWIAGQGAWEQELRKEAIILGVENQVKFLGHVAHDSLPDLYAGADVFVLPSLIETQGMVAMEAMRFRRPVIVTNRIISARELVDEGKNGFIVDPDSDQELADKLVLLFDDADLRQRMGEAGFVKSGLSKTATVGSFMEHVYFAEAANTAKSLPPQARLTESEFHLDRRQICTVCERGTFEWRIENSASQSNAQTFQEEFFAVWRCRKCRSIHSLPKVPLAEYYEKSPFRQIRMNPYIRKGFHNLKRLLEKQGINQDSRILFCTGYTKLLLDFFQSQGFRYLEKLEEPFQPLTPDSLATHATDCQDAVLVIDYLERMENPELLFALAARQLRTGGIMFINTPNAQFVDFSEKSRHVFHQPYRLHILSSEALENLARLHGLRRIGFWRRHYLDTLWPFANFSAMNDAAYFVDGSLEAGFKFHPSQMWHKWWRIPRFICLGFFGGLFPNRANMLAVFEKKDVKTRFVHPKSL
ncbi:glycosyltransferase [Propionivibrio sp.]|uniref:glycosyltransferase n=1 Tax=Propionivibrio sp. TaxID=2212460 RepID=UPI0026389C59|nr:glycosyltransferase [Propionivibrio sp.]